MPIDLSLQPKVPIPRLSMFNRTTRHPVNRDLVNVVTNAQMGRAKQQDQFIDLTLLDDEPNESTATAATAAPVEPEVASVAPAPVQAEGMLLCGCLHG